jgi:hypothetical protein
MISLGSKNKNMSDNETPESPLDSATVDYIDPVELTDTSELTLAEPVTERIARIVGDGIATVTDEAQEWIEKHLPDQDDTAA